MLPLLQVKIGLKFEDISLIDTAFNEKDSLNLDLLLEMIGLVTAFIKVFTNKLNDNLPFLDLSFVLKMCGIVKVKSTLLIS